MSDGAGQRAMAARILHRVLVERRTTDQAMAGREVDPLVQEMVLGSLRHYFSLAAAVQSALDHPLRDKDRDIEALLIVGVYQLRHMRTPDHAAIFETVGACRVLRKPWAKGLVNAVLRACAREDGEPSERSFEHPEWLEQALRRSYPDAEAIMTANNARAPMALRINRSRITPADYLSRLADSGLASRPPGSASGGPEHRLGPGPETRILEAPVSAASLPGFADGLVSVQDAGAQLAAPLLLDAVGHRDPGPVRLLDACAAPGGKLFHLLERCPTLTATALELHPDRLRRLRDEADRLGHRRTEFLEADATTLHWWDGLRFDAVLLDAPCSGTGTLRRHPDIKVLRQPEDVNRSVAVQRQLLANLWRVLEPGGTLLYCTCSILAEENDEVVGEFLAHHDDAHPATFTLPTGRAMGHGWQLLPTDPDTDGFYYARLTKAPEHKARA